MISPIPGRVIVRDSAPAPTKAEPVEAPQVGLAASASGTLPAKPRVGIRVNVAPRS